MLLFSEKMKPMRRTRLNQQIDQLKGWMYIWIILLSPPFPPQILIFMFFVWSLKLSIFLMFSLGKLQHNWWATSSLFMKYFLFRPPNKFWNMGHFWVELWFVISRYFFLSLFLISESDWCFLARKKQASTGLKPNGLEDFVIVEREEYEEATMDEIDQQMVWYICRKQFVMNIIMYTC